MNESKAFEAPVLNSQLASQQAEWRGIFSLIDRDQDGFINSSDLLSMHKSLGLDLAESDVKGMIKEVEIASHKFAPMAGRIDFDRFFVVMSRALEEQEGGAADAPVKGVALEPAEAFRVFDKSGKGVISKEDLRTVLTELGEIVDDQELTRMMRAVNPNVNLQGGPMTITFEQFAQIFA
eukprot:TRINITY_DN2265_c0_g1_i2.p1 TRINITY_DN2265_c0_g1~~TRINITY_DN2265_c0_g1_i2.p1  ORF type:complete len:193 (-),score=53.92 TRINITY_DN2265_c0_g1_i2:136-672(-)